MLRRTFSTSLRQMTKGPLYTHQPRLPDLPVPALADTLALYKQSIAPLYARGAQDPQYVQYCAKLDKFAAAEGAQLQTALEAFAQGKRNWLSEFWDNYAYMDYRDPVSPYVSYFFSHRDINTVVGKSQAHKAAAIIQLVSAYADLVDKELIEPELKKDQPFCMESFKFMFHNGRKPGKDRDYTALHDGKERFVVVISNGKFYKLDVANADLSSLVRTIDMIKVQSHLSANDSPLGILTAANRDDWYKAYSELVSISPLNEASLTEIDRSIFVLTLDSVEPNSLEDKSRNCWHGVGLNASNRWFDKPVQMFVTPSGSSGFLGEHSRMDGTPTLSMNNWLVGEFMKLDHQDFSGQSTPLEFEELKFELNANIVNSIKTEQVLHAQRTNDLAIRVWQNFGLGKKDIKTFKCSPDSFVQMLIQLAYFKLTGTLRPTYESASTRKYFKGRTETCRSVSSEALEFVTKWENPDVPTNEKIAAFREAIKSHGSYIQRASLGLGVDRHLFGLKQMIKPDEPVPEIFQDPIFAYSSKWYLSTSQLSSELFNGYGWSPVVHEGLGLAYMINNDWIHVNITAYKDNEFGIKVEDMYQCLSQASLELKEALSKEAIKAKL